MKKRSLWKLSIKINEKKRYFYFSKYSKLQKFTSYHVSTVADKSYGNNCMSKMIITHGKWAISESYIDFDYYDSVVYRSPSVTEISNSIRRKK